MSGDWPDGWRTALLNQSGLPVNDFTLRVMQAWSASTPMLPYTNNPLGMPAVKGKTLELMRTGYAMFVTMGDMRNAFAAFVNSPVGQAVHDSLALGEKFSSVWRAVHALPWPAKNTETDWPSAILDLTSESYRSQVQTVASPADRKTSGFIGTQTSFGSGSGFASRSADNTVLAIQDAAKYSRQQIGRMT